MEMSTNQIETVTIIVRTVGRASLMRALDSILLQSYFIHEVVIVNARCSELSLPDEIVQNQRIKIRIANSPLKRSPAANFGLQHATGKYCLFLDDDDWIHPEHVQRLMDTLHFHPNAIMAYAGVECIQSDSHLQTHVFDSAFSYPRLLAENYIPIHAALFRHVAWEQGCRFDESFDIHEDWDFWIQLAHLAGFIHCPGVSATYILGEEGSGIWQKQDDIGNSTLRIYEKWWKSWTAQGTLEYLQTIREELLTSHEQISKLHLLSAEHTQKQQVALSESIQYAESLRSNLEIKDREFAEHARQGQFALSESIQYAESLKSSLEIKDLEFTEHTRQEKIALLESIQYAESLRFHLENKELELKSALDQIAGISIINSPQSRKSD